ncbi:formiminotransferase-cyclodeaminase [Saccharothrix saharensis]|uniref:Formiminotransferase-cyclodeaminase n=1 Tax=Saccharothrix saharensis TaxID=571190 RepID=A0A543JQN6_9PSEU|nr:cyclodeaminase/cyclohydrolase family protein [Saccharothrix saharensis]TQM85149.1 formiminotransferase-cyclodeaminase [Saccharothrix saharensis]
MTESLWDVTAADLRARTASAGPTPGGGSVAAVFRCASVLMALEITARRDPSVGGAITAGRSPLDRLSGAADRDVELFGDYPRARRLPRSTDEERVRRQVAVEAASVAATEGPLNALRGAEADVAQPGGHATPLTARLDAVRRAAVAAHARIDSTPMARTPMARTPEESR